MQKKTLLFVLIIFWSNTFAQNIYQKADTLIDARDGQKYPTVIIGKQHWMAKNMNVGVIVKNTSQTDNQIIEKYAYNNMKENCDTLGGLYTWDEATNYKSSNGKYVQGICPKGWHIPSVEEWRILYKTVGDSQKLKATKNDLPKWDGTNESGFNAIPSGLAYDNIFGRKGDWAIYWTSTPSETNYAWSVELDNYYKTLSGNSHLEMTDTYLKINAFCIRCIEDYENNK